MIPQRYEGAVSTPAPAAFQVSTQDRAHRKYGGWSSVLVLPIAPIARSYLRGSSASRKQCHQGRTDRLRRELDRWPRAMPRTSPTAGSATRASNARDLECQGRSPRFAATAPHEQVIADQAAPNRPPPPRTDNQHDNAPDGRCFVKGASADQAPAPVSCLRYGVEDPPHPVGPLWSMESAQR